MDKLIERLSTFQARLLMAVHGIPEAQLFRPESDGKWSIASVIAHLGDVELITAMRIRLIVVEDEPELAALDQEAWVDRLHRGARVEDLASRFWQLRQQNVSLIRSLSESDLARMAHHPLAGRISLRQLIERLDEHQEKHLRQIERIKATLGLCAATGIDVSGVEAVQTSSVPHRSPGAGIRIRNLWQRGMRRALQVEIDAGAVWPSIDYHVPGPEEVYVVSGEFEDGVNSYTAGTFLHHPAGSSHVGQSRTGCVLFVYYPEG